MSLIQLLVGLANPGKKYAATRHNAGAWFVNYVLHQAKLLLRSEAKFHGGYANLTEPAPLHILIPTTFMNHSGQAVGAAMAYHKLPIHSLLVAHDDIDLPVGSIKLKFDGGDGGHNGLKDIIRHLNSKQFYRLRIGVGRPTDSRDVVDYVLHPPSKAEHQQILTAIEQAYHVLPLILAGEMQKAMQQLHTPS